MEIRRSGSRPSGTGPVESFAGTVRIDPLFAAPEPACVTPAGTAGRVSLSCPGVLPRCRDRRCRSQGL